MPMEETLFIAKLLGLIYLVAGLGFLVNKDPYIHIMNSFQENPIFQYLGGILSLCIGFSIVYVHNYWEFNELGLITFIGWAALVKGVLLLTVPRPIMYLSKAFSQRPTIHAMLVIVLGFIFLYIGFVQ